jgi:teichuronic acid exporter
LCFSWASLRRTLGFGGYVTGNDIAVYLTRNADYLLIGKFVGAGALGAYTLAFLLTDTFRSSMMSVMNRVLYPVYGRLQDDVHAVRTYYLRVIRYNMLPLVPIMVLFAALADPIVRWGFGDAWLDAIFPLKMLSVAVIVHTFGGTAASVMRGVGRADIEFKQYLVRALLFNFPVLAFGIYLAGIDGAAIAVLLIKLVGRMVQQHVLRRLIAVREIDIFRAAGPALVGGVGMWVVLKWVSTAYPPGGLVDLFSISCLGLITYGVIAGPFVRRELSGLRYAFSRT